MLKDFYCAYHHSQIVTKFCQCYDCLLPVCSICVKLHSEEHQLSASSAEYKEIKEIYEEVQRELTLFNQNAHSLGEALLHVESIRKQQLACLKNDIEKYRVKLVRKFQEALNELEEGILQTIKGEDQKFIEELQRIDDSVIEIKMSVEQITRDLKSEESLRALIEYFHSQKRSNFMKMLDQIDHDANQLSQRKYQLSSDKQLLQEINVKVMNCLHLQMSK